MNSLVFPFSFGLMVLTPLCSQGKAKDCFWWIKIKPIYKYPNYLWLKNYTAYKKAFKYCNVKIMYKGQTLCNNLINGLINFNIVFFMTFWCYGF